MKDKSDLEKLEEMMREVLRKLERLESILTSTSSDPVSRLAIELTMTFQIPVLKAVEIANRLSKYFMKKGGRDPIALAIIELLTVSKRAMSISELSKKVREIRGTASRRIIRERIRELEDEGFVKTVKAGRSLLVFLREGDGEDKKKA